MLVGCVIGDVSSPFSALLLKGIMGVCDEAGYQVLFADCNDDPERERMAIESLVANGVDGLIVNTPGGNDEILLHLKEQGKPVVLADRGLMLANQIDTVTLPNRAAVYDCVSLLKDYGYDRVGFFSEGNGRIAPRVQRYQGYCSAVKELYPKTVEPELYEFERDNVQSCKAQITKFLEKHPGERLAIITVNGVTTQRLMIAIKGMGLDFDEKLGFCGFDDWDWLQLAPSGLTSVKAPTRLMGEQAAKLLIERMSGERPMDSQAVQIELPVEIVVRESTVKK